MKLTITEYSLTTTWTALSRRTELYTWYCVCVVKTHDTNDNATTKTQSTFHTKHLNIDTWSECARSSLVFVSQVLVVMICTPHRGSSFTCARHLMVITWWAYFFDFESSISFYFLFSFSSISWTSSCTSSTTLRTVVTLPTSPKRRWTQLINPTSSQVMSPRTTTSWRLMSNPSQTVLRATVRRGCGLRWHRAGGDASHAHRVHAHHTQQEGPPVGQPPSSVFETKERPVVERGQELNTELVQFRTLLDRQREHILADCQAETERD